MDSVIRLFSHAMSTGYYEDEFQVSDESPLQPRWLHRRLMRSQEGLAVTLRDISDLKAQEQKLAQFASEDRLTGLPEPQLAGLYAAGRAGAGTQPGRTAGAAAGRPRQFQGHQRRAGAGSRRRAAAGGRATPARAVIRPVPPGAPGRRRIHGCHASRRQPGRGVAGSGRRLRRAGRIPGAGRWQLPRGARHDGREPVSRGRRQRRRAAAPCRHRTV